jgi:pyruvate kinase
MAVMIARGDLAVEIGHGRLAEMQEELLWLCEAAHAPVIWATQVLDTFVHKGVHARGELTDAAMAERAECVMLNKGPFVVDAVKTLDEVLGRMEGHQAKKTSRMRALCERGEIRKRAAHAPRAPLSVSESARQPMVRRVGDHLGATRGKGEQWTAPGVDRATSPPRPL